MVIERRRDARTGVVARTGLRPGYEPEADDRARGGSRWALLTNHGAALLYVAEHPNATVREVGDGVGITERAAARILRDLRDEGYLEATRAGRRNSYEVNHHLPLRHCATQHRQVAHLLIGMLEDSAHLR